MTKILMMTLTPRLLKNSYKKDSIKSIFSWRTQYTLQKTSRKTRTSRNHYESRRNRKSKSTIGK